MQIKITIKDCTITKFEELVIYIEALEKRCNIEGCIVEVELIHQ